MRGNLLQRTNSREQGQQGSNMIDKMRSKAASWVAKILAFFLILSFAVWGIGDVVRGPVIGNVIAEVGNSEITRTDFSNQVRRLMSVMRRQFGENFDIREAKQLGLIEQTVNQLVNSRLLKLEGETLGLTAGEDLIRETIFADQRFQKNNKKFNRIAFQRFLQQESLTESGYVEILKNEITRQQITDTIRLSTSPPKVLLNSIYKFRNEKRIAEVVYIPNENISTIRNPSESNIFDFHKNNTNQFKTPEYRKLTAIFLDPVDLAKELTPAEARIKEEYDYRKEVRTKPERRSLEQVLFQDQDKAETFYNQVKTRNNFAKAAKGQFGSRYNKLGNLYKRDMMRNLGDAVFKLGPDGVTRPIKTALGWHVVHIKKIEPAKIPSFSDLKAEIKKDIALEMAVDDIIKLTGKLDDALAGGATLGEAAEKVSAKVLRISKVDPSGLNEKGKPIPGLPKSRFFLEKVFSTPPGETSNIEETKKGEFFVLKVETVFSPKIRPLNSVRNKILTMWKQKEIRSKTRKKAQNFKEKSKGLSGLSQLAKTEGYTFSKSKAFSRFNSPKTNIIPDTLTGPLFEAKLGEIILGASNKGYHVAMVKNIIPANLLNEDTKIKEIKKQMVDLIFADNVGQYLSSLKGSYPTKIDQKAITNAIADRL